MYIVQFEDDNTLAIKYEYIRDKIKTIFLHEVTDVNNMVELVLALKRKETYSIDFSNDNGNIGILTKNGKIKFYINNSNISARTEITIAGEYLIDYYEDIIPKLINMKNNKNYLLPDTGSVSCEENESDTELDEWFDSF